MSAQNTTKRIGRPPKLYTKPGYRRKALLLYAALLRDPGIPAVRLGNGCFLANAAVLSGYIGVPTNCFSDICRYLRRLNLAEVAFTNNTNGNYTVQIILTPLIDNGFTLVKPDKLIEREKIQKLMNTIKPSSIKHLYHKIIAIYTYILMKDSKFPTNTEMTQKLRCELNRLEALFEKIDASNMCPWAIYCAIGLRRKG